MLNFNVKYRFLTDITLTPMIFWKYVYEGDLLVEKYKMQKQTSLRHIYLILASMLIYFSTLVSLWTLPHPVIKNKWCGQIKVFDCKMAGHGASKNCAKGHLISKGNFGVFKSTKKPTKFWSCVIGWFTLTLNFWYLKLKTSSFFFEDGAW